MQGRTVFAALVLFLSTLAAPAANAQDRCFPETNQCIGGSIGSFWGENGALPVFGFPITAAANEANHDTGQTYVTQWFERNRFELHPENQPPYDVLLGRLGDDRLRQLGRNWQAEPRENTPRAGCLWFEQTGHNVCNQGGNLGFRSYWETHGLRDPRLNALGRSLALFGLPLTEPRIETNASGDTVLTQWFERARFEWHPDNPDQYKVELGLLGSELRTSREPTPTPRLPDTSQCVDVPMPVSASIRPSNCVREGMLVYYDVFGFQPNEQVAHWLTAPGGAIAGAQQTLPADSRGRLDNLAFNTRGLQAGVWYWVFEGISSGHNAIVFVKVTPGS